MVNVIRQIKNQAKEIARKREELLKREREAVLNCFTNGNRTAKFWFNAHNCHISPDLAAFLKAHDLNTDQWRRAIWDLDQPTALELARLVVESDQIYIYAVTNADEDRSSNWIAFAPATPEEEKRDEQDGWKDPFGAWIDVPDTILDQIRHSNPPKPQLEVD